MAYNFSGQKSKRCFCFLGYSWDLVMHAVCLCCTLPAANLTPPKNCHPRGLQVTVFLWCVFDRCTLASTVQGCHNVWNSQIHLEDPFSYRVMQNQTKKISLCIKANGTKLQHTNNQINQRKAESKTEANKTFLKYLTSKATFCCNVIIYQLAYGCEIIC